MNTNQHQDATLWMLNGHFNAPLLIAERGLSYGDGVFTTMAWRNNRVEFQEQHLARLKCDAKALCFKLDQLQVGNDLSRFLFALKNRRHREGVIKIRVTRGVTTTGYAFPADLSPTILISFSPLPSDITERRQHGVFLRLCQQRLRQQCAPGAKHLNRLEQVLARAEWHRLKTPLHYLEEGLMCNAKGQPIEAIAANLFWFKQGQLATPSLERVGVAGIIRQQLLDLRPECQVSNFALDDLHAADEVFICNSLTHICPVVALFDEAVEPAKIQTWPIGRHTRYLQQQLQQLME